MAEDKDKDKALEGKDPKDQVVDKKPDPKSESEDKDVNIRLNLPDGKTVHLSPEQVIIAAQYGMSVLEENKKKKDKPAKEEDAEPEDDVVTLKREVAALKEERKREKDFQEINNVLFRLEKSHPETKKNQKLAQKISQLTLARINMNPELHFDKVFKEELKDYLDMVPEEKTEDSGDKKDANAAVRRSMIKTIRGGSAPVVESEKKYGVKEFKSGESRKAMLAWAERAQQENR